jgi:hypothetical protein
MPEKQKNTKKRREKKIKGGVWPFDLLKKEEPVVGDVVATATVEPVAPETNPKISEADLEILKNDMVEKKAVYDAAKKAYNDAKPSMFGFFGGKTKKRRSKK